MPFIQLNDFCTCLIIDGNYTDTSWCCATYGYGSGSIHLNYLACYGNEFRLYDCNYRNETYLYHYEDWGVLCYNGKTCIPKRDVYIACYILHYDINSTFQMVQILEK